MIPLAIVVSAVLTLLAVIGIWEKDRPEFFGVGNKQEKVKLKEYIAILKANKELQRLMVAGAGCKLAFSVVTEYDSTLYALRSNDGRLRRTVSSNDDRWIYFLCSILPFDGKDITEAWTESFTGALYNACTGHVHWSFSVVVVMEAGGSAFNLSLRSINVYTVLFVLFFGIGYGAYYATADMPIPMVADCSDYETYRSGQY